MNTYPSSNFATVFFLVLLFIGTGLLMYHTYEVTVENGQLKEVAGNLQASVDTLTSDNETLKGENAALAAENTSLVAENRQLKASLEASAGELAALKQAVADQTAQLEKLNRENSDLKSENQQLKSAPGKNGGGVEAKPVMLQSSLLPDGAGFWLEALAGVTLGLLLIAFYTAQTRVRKIRLQQVATQRRGSPFVDR